MSKKRKTKKEKMQRNIKQQEFSQNTHETIYSIEKTTFQKTSSPHSEAAHTAHVYVMQDVRKTLLTTSAIIAVTIILFILIQSKLINLSFLGY